jgi:hypothetical protein
MSYRVFGSIHLLLQKQKSPTKELVGLDKDAVYSTLAG